MYFYMKGSTMYGLFGKMVAQTGQREALIDLLNEALTHLRQLDGCLLYILNLDPTDENAIWIYEAWESQADHQASLNNEAIRAVIMQARPLIAEIGKEQFTFIPIAGKGLGD
jgi:quinol monooxygenase YgiN